MIAISSLGRPIAHETLRFSGGEVQVRIAQSELGAACCALTLDAMVANSDDVMELLLLTDACRRSFGDDAEIHLRLPYLPYARQDRVCAPGEALSLRVFCDLINAQGYASVEVWDCHSDVGLALLDRVVDVPQSVFVGRIDMGESTHLVAPDAGAMKKIYQVAEATGLPVVRADKKRDPQTGAITGTAVYSDPVGGDDFLIVDDICDGGRTFIELAKVLRPLTGGKIKLYVTHGIFSRGLEVFEGVIDEVYCPNVFPSVSDHKLLQRI